MSFLYRFCHILVCFESNIYRIIRLNGSLFGAIDESGKGNELDDDDEYENKKTKRKRTADSDSD